MNNFKPTINQLPEVNPGPRHLNSVLERRKLLARRMLQISGERPSVAILFSGNEQIRNKDVLFPFRASSDFLYLSGFSEPEAWLFVYVNASGTLTDTIFSRKKIKSKEIWDGIIAGQLLVKEKYGVKNSFPVDELNSEVLEIIEASECIFAPFNDFSVVNKTINSWILEVEKKKRSGVDAPKALFNLNLLTEDSRQIKDSYEIQTMRQAAKISSLAHMRAMKFCKAGVSESHLEAELLHEFKIQGAQDVAYPSIVASGPHTCILHHRAGKRILNDGELLLIDAGCELNGYASDITRTFPISGRFSAVQRDIYEIVRAAQAEAIEKAKPGVNISDPHDAAVRCITRGLLDLGLIKSASLEDAIQKKDYFRFYMHRTGHWLGLDVHDVGSYKKPLSAGMVMTVEPGIYISPAEDLPEHFWNIGIRIEDDILITESGCEILSEDVPANPDEIQYLMCG
tara:strand:+ start:20773 stop:22137 length:1365 start_codon:yes stop_codon:yes gene_type:complete